MGSSVISLAPALVGRTVSPTAENLCLYFTSGEWLFAMPANLVERIIAPEDARNIPVAESRKNPTCKGLIVAGPRAYCAWDLASLLKIEAATCAWILLDTRTNGGTEGPSCPMALAVGHCLSVGALPKSSVAALIPGATKERPRAISAAFPTSLTPAGRPNLRPAGLLLNVPQLWLAAEWSLASRLLGGSPLKGG